MQIVKFVRLPLFPIVVLAAAACDRGPVEPQPGQNEIQVPTAYAFESRFQAGASSVDYSGQIVRNLLVQDLKVAIDRLGKPGARPITSQQLRSLYEYNDALNLSTLTESGSAPAKEARYSAIATGKSVKNAPVAADAVIGYGKTVDQLMGEWFEIIASNSQDSKKLGTVAVYTTAEGVNLAQMVEKVLHGAVAYQRGTGNYLAKVLEQPNTAAEAGKPYTKMEHYWDEAFGYFGAARDLARYSDAQLAGSVAQFAFDSNSDGKIDFQSEYNFAFAKSAGKRDNGGTGVDFTKEVFDAFLKGRTLIVNQGTTQQLAAQATIVSQTWEKVIAATVVHYINDVLKDMAKSTPEQVSGRNNAALNNHWGEMKGYAIGLQFNPAKQISTARLERLHGLLGNAPPYAATGTAAYTKAVADLNAAKAILKEAYGFSEANMAAW
ncbi:MAG: DUF4856 domain-containing protein [Gemmatimonadetes bacterium]|nr:DUF4856 domain-containing protein [Gemmatimonadota bacterium]